MAGNMSGPLLRYWEMFTLWAKGFSHDVIPYVESYKGSALEEEVQFEHNMFSSISQEAIDYFTSFGSQEQQTESLRMIFHVMCSSHQMGRWFGHIESTQEGSDPKSIDSNLDIARRRLLSVNLIKRDVVKENTERLWNNKPEFIGNIHGTASIIMDKANAEIRQRCSKLSKKDRANEPEEGIKIRAMQDWVKRAETALAREGKFAGQ